MVALTASRSFTFNVYLGGSRPDRRPVDVYSGESVEIVFNVLDRKGAAVDLAGATVEYKIARRGYGYAAIGVYGAGNGVSVTGNKITAAFDVVDSLVAGFHDDQLSITKDGKTIVASSGRFNVRPDIE